ncbi:MAG: DUF1566 domain-containing protein [Methylovulum sp.]|nr:MAG: DUF1566 domain-containing protein [Methylovulum sp.]
MKSMYKQLAIALMLAAIGINTAHAVTPAGKPVTATIVLQGGSDSAAKWSAPSTATYKVHVLVPKTGTTANALYRVYPKGKKAGSIDCINTDAEFPCYEVMIDQTQHKNAWVQLMLNDDVETQWGFIKNKGYVTAVAGNLSAAELLNLSALARFEDTLEDTVRAIGKNYQGGIIFYLDNTGEHGLIAAQTDQSTGIQWYNGTHITTGATGTAVGTGLANTSKIIKAQGAGFYAAKLCAKLVIGAYSDWYLPSLIELKRMYQNIGPAAAAPLTNVGGFASAAYWSSSEGDSTYAWEQYFSSGGRQFYTNKSGSRRVRAVRAF